MLVQTNQNLRFPKTSVLCRVLTTYIWRDYLTSRFSNFFAIYILDILIDCISFVVENRKIYRINTNIRTNFFKHYFNAFAILQSLSNRRIFSLSIFWSIIVGLYWLVFYIYSFDVFVACNNDFSLYIYFSSSSQALFFCFNVLVNLRFLFVSTRRFKRFFLCSNVFANLLLLRLSLAFLLISILCSNIRVDMRVI